MEANIKLLQKQISIDEDAARELLKKHNNNIVNCVLDSYGMPPTEPPEEPPKYESIFSKNTHNITQVNGTNVKVI